MPPAGSERSSRTAGTYLEWAEARPDGVSHELVIDPLERVMIHHRRDGSAIGTAILHGGERVLEPPGIGVDIAALFRSVSMRPG